MNRSELPTELKERSVELGKTWSDLYCLTTKSGFIIVRPLTRREFITVMDLQDYMQTMVDDFVFNTCVLYPELSRDDKDNMLAGTVSGVIDSILALSGFASPEGLSKLLDENRSTMGLADSQIIVAICKAFPHITPEEINKFNIQKITYYLALAEQILGISMDLNQSKKQKASGPIDFGQENKDLKNSGNASFNNSKPS